MCSYAPDTDQGGVRLGASQLDLGSIQQRGQQELSSGGISVRLYTGYIFVHCGWCDCIEVYEDCQIFPEPWRRYWLK
jgi:hypothetical protein